jgi:hypothetical protein
MNLHGRIISLRGDIWAHITSLIPPRFIEVPVLIQKSERVTFCVLGYRFFLFMRFLIFYFGIVSTLWYFAFFNLLDIYLDVTDVRKILRCKNIFIALNYSSYFEMSCILLQ